MERCIIASPDMHTKNHGDCPICEQGALRPNYRRTVPVIHVHRLNNLLLNLRPKRKQRQYLRLIFQKQIIPMCLPSCHHEHPFLKHDVLVTAILSLIFTEGHHRYQAPFGSIFRKNVGGEVMMFRIADMKILVLISKPH